MQKPINQTAAFASRFGLEYSDATYLHDALNFYRVASCIARDERPHAAPKEVEQLASDLMRAAMAAKHQPEFPSLSGLQHTIDALAEKLDTRLDEIASAVYEHSGSQTSNLRELAEAVRTVADGENNVCHSLEALRRVADDHLEVIQRRMSDAALVANDDCCRARNKGAA